MRNEVNVEQTEPSAKKKDINTEHVRARECTIKLGHFSIQFYKNEHYLVIKWMFWTDIT